MPKNREIIGVEVIGERGSGTNFLSRLLKNNYSVKVNKQNLFHKHFNFNPSIPVRHSNILFVIIVREPIAWVKSLHKNPWQLVAEKDGKNHVLTKNKDLFTISEFIRTELETPEMNEKSKNVAHLRNKKLNFYISLLTNCDNVVMVHYDDIRKDQRIIERIAEKFNIKMKSPFKEEEFKETKREELNKEDTNFLNSELNQDLEESILKLATK